MQKGTMMAINTTRDLGSTVGRFYLSFNNTTPTEPVFLLPVSDLADQGKLCSYPISLCFIDSGNS